MAYRNFTNPELLQLYLNQQFNQPDLSEVMDTNSTEVIDTGMPVFNTFDLTKGGITDIPINIEKDEEEQYPYLGYNNMGYETPRTIADQNRILGQTFTPPEQNFQSLRYYKTLTAPVLCIKPCKSLLFFSKVLLKCRI